MLFSPLCRRGNEHESLVQGVPVGRATSMRADSKHSPAAHCDFACGRSGLSCNSGGSGTSQAPRRGTAATMRASHGIHLPIYVQRYTEQRDRGGCRVRWAGWLDTGLGSMHTARPTPLLRRSSSRSLPPSTPCSHIIEFVFSFIFLSRFLWLSFYAFRYHLLSLSLSLSPPCPPLPPLPFFASPNTYSSICPCTDRSSLCRGSLRQSVNSMRWGEIR